MGESSMPTAGEPQQGPSPSMAPSGKTGSTELMKRLKDNFFVVVCSAAATVGGVVFAVVTYWHSQTIENLKQQHEMLLTAKVSELTGQKRKLESQLLSIQRIVGQKESLFDVTQLTISGEQARALSVPYEELGGGKILVLKTDGGKWKYQPSTELASRKGVSGSRQ